MRYVTFFISMVLPIFVVAHCVTNCVSVHIVKPTKVSMSNIRSAKVISSTPMHRELVLWAGNNRLVVSADTREILPFRPQSSWMYRQGGGNAIHKREDNKASDIIHLLPLSDHLTVIARCKNASGEAYALPMTLKSDIWQDKTGRQYSAGDTAVLNDNSFHDNLEMYRTDWVVSSPHELTAGSYQCVVPEIMASENQLEHSQELVAEGSNSVGVHIMPFSVYVKPSLTVSVVSGSTVLNLSPNNHYIGTSFIRVSANTPKIAIAYQCNNGSFNRTMCAMSNRFQSNKKLPIQVGISDNVHSINAFPYSVGLTDSYLVGSQKHYYLSNVTPNMSRIERMRVKVPSSYVSHAALGQYSGMITVNIYAVPAQSFTGLN